MAGMQETARVERGWVAHGLQLLPFGDQNTGEKFLKGSHSAMYLNMSVLRVF